jgi:hypothetical protein
MAANDIYKYNKSNLTNLADAQVKTAKYVT